MCMLALGATAMPAAAQPGPRIGQGSWTGYVSFSTEVGVFRGGFDIVSVGGTLDGVFSWTGPATIAGEISGPDTRPRFDVTQASSGGVIIRDASGSGEVRLTHTTCERVEGVAENIEAAQFIDFGTVVWFAVRDGVMPDVTSFFDTIELLRQRAGEIAEDLANNVAATEATLLGLGILVREAEELASRAARFDECSDLGEYRSVIAAELAPILEALAANTELFAVEWARVVLNLSMDGIIDGDAEVALRENLSLRLENAVLDDDLLAIELLGGLADLMGWFDLADAADLLLEELS